jgi:hypothetical protein
MKLASPLLLLVALTATAEPLEEYDGDRSGKKTRFPSPDGCYCLLITYDEEPDKDRVEIIERDTQRVMALLSDPDGSLDRSSDARLEWSPDSKRVAAYTGGRRGGSTQIFVRIGRDLKEVKLPKLPALPDKPSAAAVKKHKWEFVKVITVYELSFVRWLKGGGLVLEASNSNSGTTGTLGWTYEYTINIDDKGNARLSSVNKSEVFDE